jgi:hypothetical protein
MEMSGLLHAPAALAPGKSVRYPKERRLGRSQRHSGRCGEESVPMGPAQQTAIWCCTISGAASFETHFVQRKWVSATLMFIFWSLIGSNLNTLRNNLNKIYVLWHQRRISWYCLEISGYCDRRFRKVNLFLTEGVGGHKFSSPGVTIIPSGSIKFWEFLW